MKPVPLDIWKKEIKENKNRIILATIFLVLASVATLLSNQYVDEVSTTSVSDMLLDILPVVDLSFIYVWGGVLVFAAFFAYPIFYKPQKFHTAIGYIGLFYLIRAGFMVLTHLKAPSEAITINAPQILQFLAQSNDLFFSGHAGLPFLGYLIFKTSKIRYFMLSASIILAATVLLMHAHYSIDVASAYFITFGIYIIGKPLFENSA